MEFTAIFFDDIGLARSLKPPRLGVQDVQVWPDVGSAVHIYDIGVCQPNCLGIQ
jgi:hypothetical protein